MRLLRSDSFFVQAEAKRPKSKEELARIAAAKRDAALAQPLHATEPSSKGLKMMQAMGFQTGGVLGKQRDGSDARAEPLTVQVKEDRGGIGLDSERKRKIREEFEGEVKRQKAEEGDYRERVRLERETRRIEGQILGAQKVAERLSSGEGDGSENDRPVSSPTTTTTPPSEQPHADHPLTGREKGEPSTPLQQINVLWRGLIRHRLQRERERRIRHDLHQSLSRLPTYAEDPDDDDAAATHDLKRALGKDDRPASATTATLLVQQQQEEEDLEAEDPELDAFNALDPPERLRRLVAFLRQRFRYCFWCKFRYEDEAMEGCPGVTEEDHD